MHTHLKQKDTDDGGNAVDPRLSSALKIRRMWDEIISKQFRHRSVEIDLDIRNLWTKAARIASSDCTVSHTVRLRLYRDVPSRDIVTNIREDMQKFVNNRGQQLRKLRLKRYEEDKKRSLALNPSKAFQY